MRPHMDDPVGDGPRHGREGRGQDAWLSGMDGPKYIALLQAEPTAIPCPRPAPDSARVGAVPG